MRLVTIAQGERHAAMAEQLSARLTSLGLLLRVVKPSEHWALAKLRVLAEATEPTVLLDADLVVREWPAPWGFDVPAIALASYRPRWGNSGVVYSPGGQWVQSFAALLGARLNPPYWDEWVLNRAAIPWHVLPRHWCDTSLHPLVDALIVHPCGRAVSAKEKHEGKDKECLSK